MGVFSLFLFDSVIAESILISLLLIEIHKNYNITWGIKREKYYF